MKPLLPLLPLAALLAGCSRPAEPVAPPAPPPLSPEVQPRAAERGHQIAAATFSVLSSNLQSAIQSGGVVNALPFCSLAAAPLTKSVAQEHGVSVRRVTHRPRNPAARANSQEAAVLEGFAAAIAAGATNPPPTAVVTNLVPGHATYFAPILLSQPLCLQCHGDPERDIPPAALATLRRLYPQDEATGFQPGQLRGMWRIDLPLAALNAPIPEAAPRP
jgi:hypothetical protein